MRQAGYFNAEWGYLAPAPNFLRTARLFVVAAAIGATASAAVVFSLMDRPSAETSVAARTLVQPIEPAPPARSAAVVAQLQKQSELPSEHAPVSEARHTNAPSAMRLQDAAVVAHVGAGPSAASESGAASTTQHAPVAAALSESPGIMAAEALPARAAASESNAVPAQEAAPAPAPAPKVPIKKSRAVVRVAPRYGLPRYAAPRYEQRHDSMERGPYAFLRQYGPHGGQEY
jgi:hypothetical protein